MDIRQRINALDLSLFDAIDTQLTDADRRSLLALHVAWREVYGSFDYLEGIEQATLVVNGSNDIVVPTVNSYILQQNLPNAELILFPDSNHGSHFQFTERFVKGAANLRDGLAHRGLDRAGWECQFR